MANVNQYSNDYMAEINRRKAINPNDPFIKDLETARNQKISSNPEAYGKYSDMTKALWEQNPSSGNYYEMDVATGGALGGEYDAPWGNEITTSSYDNWMSEFKTQQQALADAQRQSRISALGKARDSALSGLDAEKATIDPYYYDKRNQAAGASDVSAMNFAQFMAGRGIKGSAGAMPEMYRNAALQGQIGRLDTQQAAEHSDIARRRSGIQSAYESDVASANADIDAQTMQNYINQMRTVEAQRIADMASQGKTSTGELNLQGQNAQSAEYERQAALIAAANYDDIMAEINRRSSIDPNDPIIPYLHVARRQKMTDQADRAAAAAAAAGEAQQMAWNNALKLFQEVGRITSVEQAQLLGLPTNATVADVDIARMNANTSAYNAQTGRINATKPPAEKEVKYSYTTDPDFGNEVAYINSNPNALRDIQANATALIQKYGYDGYIELVKLATPKEE